MGIAPPNSGTLFFSGSPASVKRTTLSERREKLSPTAAEESS